MQSQNIGKQWRVHDFTKFATTHGNSDNRHASPGGPGLTARQFIPEIQKWEQNQLAAWWHMHARQAVSGQNPEFPEKQRQKEKEFMQLYKTVHNKSITNQNTVSNSPNLEFSSSYESM